MKKAIAQQLKDAQVVIDNALNKTHLHKPLKSFGYDLEKIRGGKALLERALMLQSAQKKEYGQQFSATDKLQAARQEAEAQYIKHVKLARMALKGDRSARNALQLDGLRKRSMAGWLSQARIFYTNVMEMPHVLEGYGVNAEELATTQAMVEAVADELAHHKDEKTTAQHATRQRNEALMALNQWVADFLSVARIALRENPQALEALGEEAA